MADWVMVSDGKHNAAQGLDCRMTENNSTPLSEGYLVALLQAPFMPGSPLRLAHGKR